MKYTLMSRGTGKMLIGELARQVGLTPPTIRFYEKKGLLDARHMTRMSNNYKEYNPTALERLHRVSQAKSAGFTLSETVQLFREWDTLGPKEQRGLLLDKIKQIKQRMTELEKMEMHLTEKLALLEEHNR